MKRLGLTLTRKATHDLHVALDTDGNGLVDMSELWNWLIESSGRKPAAKESVYTHLDIPRPDWGTTQSIGATVPPRYEDLKKARALSRANKTGMMLADNRSRVDKAPTFSISMVPGD